MRFDTVKYVRMEEKCFERFLSLLENDKVYLKKDITFSDICAMAGAGTLEMEEFLTGTFGLNGEELLKIYREGKPVYFL